MSNDMCPSSVHSPAGADRDRRVSILKGFLQRFLPPVEGRHRNAANECRYVCTTLSRVMLQWLDLRVSPGEVMEALLTTSHTFFTRDGYCRPDGSPMAAPQQRDLFGEIIMDSLPQPSAEERIHTGLSGGTVRLLRLTTIPLPDGTSDEKTQQIEELRHRLSLWRDRVLAAEP